jgi:hypothetical protein
MKHFILAFTFLSFLHLSAQNSSTLPAFPQDEAINLYTNCTLIDIIYMKPAFSMSMEDKYSIQMSIKLLTPNTFIPIPNDKPFAKVFYQIKGNIVHQADLYYNMETGKGGYIFYENNVKKYSSEIHPSAKAYYDSVMEEVKKGGEKD